MAKLNVFYKNGEVTKLQCGGCGSTDIREHDKAERWNDIEIFEGTLLVSQQDSEFHTVGILCADCGNDLDVDPKDKIFNLMSWS